MITRKRNPVTNTLFWHEVTLAVVLPLLMVLAIVLGIIVLPVFAVLIVPLSFALGYLVVGPLVDRLRGNTYWWPND